MLLPTIVRRWPLSAILASVLPHFVLDRTEAQPLSNATLGTPVLIHPINDVQQMAFDPLGATLYMVNYDVNTVVAVSPTDALPLTPVNASVWPSSVIAGIFSVPGPVGPAEETSFMSKTYPGAAWVGLWICELHGNTVRFINFGRGKNVTLVAGSRFGAMGSVDGIGAAALLTSPQNLAWGRFLRNAVSGGQGGAAGSGWTTVVYWSETDSHCIRQGVPLTKSTLLPLNGSAGESLQDMALNVTSFAGLCGTGGSDLGLAYRRTVVNSPKGVAVVNPFYRTGGVRVGCIRPSPTAMTAAALSGNTDTTVMFVGDTGNRRVSMITPMYPEAARFLTVLALPSALLFYGLAVARVMIPTNGNAGGTVSTRTVELFVGTSQSRDFINISVTLAHHSRRGVMKVVDSRSQPLISGTTSIFASYNAAFLRYVSASSEGTLVVLSGSVYGQPETYKALQYYCCLSVDYSVPIDVESNNVTCVTPTASRTAWISTTTSSSMTPSRMPGALTPVGTPIAPFGSTDVQQMVYDPHNDTLYLSLYDRSTIVLLSDAASVPLYPFHAAPWGYSVLAGRDGTTGSPNATEVRPEDARFRAPAGIVGWPANAVGPYAAGTGLPVSPTMATPGSTSSSFVPGWVGLWICDFMAHTIRFINFRRGNNVTLAAGNNLGLNGTRDGLGSESELNYPHTLAFGRFVVATFTRGKPPRPSASMPSQWQSLIFWSDSLSHCIRYGEPLHDNPPLYSPLTGAVNESLADMILNVTTFAGLCRTAGFMTGPAYRRTVLDNPIGIALVNPFPLCPSVSSHAVCGTLRSNTTSVLFVGERGNRRLSIIAPMFPTASRFLVVVYTNMMSEAGIIGVALGYMGNPSTIFWRRVGGSTTPTMFFVNTVQVYLGIANHHFVNISIPLFYDTSTGNISIVIPAGTTSSVGGQRVIGVTEVKTLATTSIEKGYYVALMRKLISTDSGTQNVTVMLFSGHRNASSDSSRSFQFYCCLEAAYASEWPTHSSDPICWITPTVSVSLSKTRGIAKTPSTSCSSSVSYSKSHIYIRNRPKSSSVPPRFHSFSTSSSRSTDGPTAPGATRTVSVVMAPPIPAALTPAVLSAVASFAGFGAIAGANVATSLGTMGLAQRCLIPIEKESGNQLSFPQSAVPSWAIGPPSSDYPRLPYYRAAAVSALIIHVIIFILSAIMALIFIKTKLLERPQSVVGMLLKLPLSLLMTVDGLFLDGGVGGGASAVQAGGVQELGFLCCGLSGSLFTIFIVFLSVWKRSSLYDFQWLVHGASLRKRQAYSRQRGTLWGRLHGWVVGTGAWKDVTGVGRLLLPAYGKYIGTDRSSTGTAAPEHHHDDGVDGGDDDEQQQQQRQGQSSLLLSRIRMQWSPYFFLRNQLITILISASRAMTPTAQSCLVPTTIVALLCTILTLVLILLRPMTSIIKNFVAIVLSVYGTITSWILWIAALQGSIPLFEVALSMAVGNLFLSGFHIAITVISFLLSLWITRSSKGDASHHHLQRQAPLLNATALDHEEGTDEKRGSDDDDDDDAKRMSLDHRQLGEEMIGQPNPRDSGGGESMEHPLLSDMLADVDDVEGKPNSTTHVEPLRADETPGSLTSDSVIDALLSATDSVVVNRPAMPLTQLRDVRLYSTPRPLSHDGGEDEIL